jgi:hypothetical protein
MISKVFVPDDFSASALQEVRSILFLEFERFCIHSL